MQKTVTVLVVKLFFAFTAAAQPHNDTAHLKTNPILLLKDSTHQKPFFPLTVLPSNFYAAHLPFFCDKELKLQKAVKMSVKFRLGSVDACDKLEGKP
jgi:hypothetical protein